MNVTPVDSEEKRPSADMQNSGEGLKRSIGWICCSDEQLVSPTESADSRRSVEELQVLKS